MIDLEVQVKIRTLFIIKIVVCLIVKSTNNLRSWLIRIKIIFSHLSWVKHSNQTKYLVKTKINYFRLLMMLIFIEHLQHKILKIG